MFQHMYFEIVSLDACKVTLVAPVWLFSSVCFQMRPQMTCLRGCEFTLVAFVWLFSTMCSQMSFQSACIFSSIITLVALVILFSLICSSHWNFFIGLALIQKILSKILIHYQQCFLSNSHFRLTCKALRGKIDEIGTCFWHWDLRKWKSVSRFSSPIALYPLYFDVIVDLGHIWGPFLAEIENAFWFVHNQNSIPILAKGIMWQ